MRVLIGLDGSDDAYAAIDLAHRLISTTSDELVLYFSLPAINPSWHHRVKPEFVDRARTALSAAVFNGATDRLPTALASKVKTIVGTQEPGHGLLSVADECRADLIVLGARGAEPHGEVALGGVARQVAHQATLPVLVARPSRRPRGDGGLRVLFATDQSSNCQQVSAVLNKFTWPADTVGRLMTVVEEPWAGQIPPWLELEMQNYDLAALGFATEKENEASKARAHEQLRQSCGGLPSMFQREEPIIAVGIPSRQILSAISNNKIDLVAVGARRSSAIGRWFLGSTSERLLTSAPCSVLLVRQHEHS